MTSSKSRQIRRTFLSLFLNFLIFGAITTIIGATLPMVIEALGWNYLEAGTVIAAHAVGYFTTTLVAGIVVRRIGFRNLICVGLLLQAAGVGCFGFSPLLFVNVAAFLVLGAGQGATELVTNYSVVQMEKPGSSRLMNLMHSAFTLGAIFAPIMAGILTDRSVPWRLIYVMLAVVSVAMIALFLASGFGSIDPGSEQLGSCRTLLGSLRRPLLPLLTLTLFLYVGVEIGVSNWVAEYGVRVFASAPSQAAYLVSVFWAGILLGRLSTSLLYHGNRQALILFVFSSASGLFLTGALLSSDPILSTAFFFCTGLGCSVIYPTVMSIVGDAYPDRRGVAIGVAAAGGGVGMCVFPWAMAAIANFSSIERGFWFYVLGTAAMTAAAAVVYWRMRKPSR